MGDKPCFGAESDEELELTYNSNDGQTDGRTRTDLDGLSSDQVSGPLGPQEYISIRITQKHGNLDTILSDILFDVDDYCIYPHFLPQQHFHICIPGTNDGKYRKRVMRYCEQYGIKGNKAYQLKRWNNYCRKFMHYGSHEGTKPIFKETSFWDDIKIIKPFIKGGGQKLIEECPERAKDRKLYNSWQLTFSNFVNVAVEHRRKFKLKTESLKEVIRHLCQNTKWRASPCMRKGGNFESYQKDFEFSIGVRKEYDMSWWTEKTY